MVVCLLFVAFWALTTHLEPRGVKLICYNIKQTGLLWAMNIAFYSVIPKTYRPRKTRQVMAVSPKYKCHVLYNMRNKQ